MIFYKSILYIYPNFTGCHTR